MSKHHPAIGDDEFEVWDACCQLQYPGAKVTVSNYSWERNKKDRFDSLYFRGLALRHSNGDTGKYETFTYTPTEQLLAWARQQDLHRASFSDALQGRDVAKELRNLRRRARYAQQRDRKKHWPGDPCPMFWGTGSSIRSESELAKAHATLNQTTSPADYVRAWAALNHLKP